MGLQEGNCVHQWLHAQQKCTMLLWGGVRLEESPWGGSPEEYFSLPGSSLCSLLLTTTMGVDFLGLVLSITAFLSRSQWARGCNHVSKYISSALSWQRQSLMHLRKERVTKTRTDCQTGQVTSGEDSEDKMPLEEVCPEAPLQQVKPLAQSSSAQPIGAWFLQSMCSHLLDHNVQGAASHDGS